MTWQPATINHDPPRTFTDEEMLKYATYHFLETDDGAHVWRTIGGYCEYFGILKDGDWVKDEDRPLYPSLEQPDGSSGPVPAQGGELPYPRKETV